MEILFESADVRLLHHPGDGRDECVVTFSSLNMHDQPFGGTFFEQRGVPAFHFLALWNHWWQPDSVMAAVERAAQALKAAGKSRVMTYGSSMGGYGAAMHARALGATSVLMLAPQWSPDPARPPHETRWAAEARRITFLRDDMGAFAAPEPVKYAAFDPCCADGKHAALYATIPNTVLLRCHDAGHALGHTLQQANLLSDLVFQALRGTIDAASWRQRWVEKRRLSGRFWYEFGKRLERRKRPALALRFLEKAVELLPREVQFLIDYGYGLAKSGEAEKAIAMFQRAVEVAPAHPAPLRGLSTAFRRARQPAAAVDAALKALELRRGSGDLTRVLAHALVDAGQFGRAVDSLLLLPEPELQLPESQTVLKIAVAKLDASLMRRTGRAR
jgi:tetratricopeptide (TPR) repeat protein